VIFWDLVEHREPLHDRFTTVYVQPLGEMTATQQRLLDDTADFLDRFFGFPVKLQEALPLDNLPASARRAGSSESAADEQFLTTYILDEVLGPRIPADAVAMLGLTSLGQAHLGRLQVSNVRRIEVSPHGAASCRFATRPALRTRPGHPPGCLPVAN
jgi:hypothetical protein